MNRPTVTRNGEKREEREGRKDRKAGTRDRIVRSAAELLAEGGRDAVSTRAVAEAAGVQPPTIYRLFGDMRGLLDEVVSFGFSVYSGEKVASGSIEDPVEELRRGWELHVGFGLANPALYKLMYGDPVPGSEPPTAATEAFAMLRALVHRIAETGRLRVTEERATRIIHAAAMGTTLTLIGLEPEDRDGTLSETTREAILAAVTTEASTGKTGEQAGKREANHAVSLKAVLPETGGDLTSGERALLLEWLDRLS